MLDYKELSQNPYHLNRNQTTLNLDDEELKKYMAYLQQSVEPQHTNIWDLAGIGVGAGMDWYGAQGPSQAQLQESINPLEEQYKNLTDMAEEYRDPNSEMNMKMRESIRSQNLEAITDATRRAANQAMGTVDDSMGAKNIGQTAIKTAISDALENYNLGHANRLKSASEYDARAAAAANTLSTARQQNLAYEQAMKQKQADVGIDTLGQMYKWGKGFDWGGAGDWFKGLFNK
jgi:chromosome segregation ATPase